MSENHDRPVSEERPVSELTIMEIARRMLQFSANSELVDAADYPESYNRGISDALIEMRGDMERLTEAQFIEKYEEAAMNKGDEIFAVSEYCEEDGDDEKIEYLQGYCSAVEDILNLISPSRLYEQMTMLREGVVEDVDDSEIDDAFLDEIFS